MPDKPRVIYHEDKEWVEKSEAREWCLKHHRAQDRKFAQVIVERDKLQAKLDKAVRCLNKIKSNEFLAYRQGSTGSEHHYLMGVTDGHRLASKWAAETLAELQADK